MPNDLIILNGDFPLLKNGYLVKRNIWSQFVFEAIDTDKLAVQFFFVLVKLVELLFPFCLEVLHEVFKTIGGCTTAALGVLIAEGNKGIALVVP